MKLTYERRFIEALSSITGSSPPSDLVSDWVNGVERDDDLQNWVGSLGRYAPWWAQSIAILDACAVMASNPIEGEPDKIDYSQPMQRASAP